MNKVHPAAEHKVNHPFDEPARTNVPYAVKEDVNPRPAHHTLTQASV